MTKLLVSIARIRRTAARTGGHFLLLLTAAWLAGCEDSNLFSSIETERDLVIAVTDFGPVYGTARDGSGSSGSAYAVQRAPASGSLSVDPANGQFEYLPSSYAIGSDDFVISYKDAIGRAATLSVRVEHRSGLDSRPANTSCLAPERPPSTSPVKATRMFSGIGQWDLISIYQTPVYPDHWYGIVKQGQVIRFENRADVSSYTTVLDISPRVVSDTESGLIGFAFHPNFENNGKIYIYWTGLGSPTISYLSEFTSLDGGLTLDPTSERVLFSINHTTTRHKGGHIEFGTDGYLYMSIGDGGPMEQAQDVTNLFGTMIRIDPDNGDPYAIPPDNPFANGGGRPEIFAWGFRNPWRWSFDESTGDIWLGDVGRNSWEEVDIVHNGGNYGWPIMEGAQCQPPATSCNSTGFVDPIYQYPHESGSTSIIGGFVYNGDLMPTLRGKYVFADIGRLIQVLESESDGSYTATTLVSSGLEDRGIWSLSKDLNGEIYVVKPDGIFQLQPDDQPSSPSSFPATLSATGCFNAADPTKPVPGLIPYDINVPFWSNGAEKYRYMAIPDDTRIAVDADGNWVFPVGSVLAKAFYFDDRPVETRLLVRHDDGDWAGYAYAWRPDSSDADLASGAVSLEDQGIAHTIPSRPQCMQCHVGVAGDSLGPENLQMNKFVQYSASGDTANQVATLQEIGMLDASFDTDPADIERLPDTNDDSVDIVARAKAYLHSNCSNCHRPDGPGRGSADFRYSIAHADMGVCNAPVETDDFGIAGVAVVVPGHPELSALNIRAARLELAAMPPLGKQAVDSAGVALLDEYVSSLANCP